MACLAVPYYALPCPAGHLNLIYTPKGTRRKGFELLSASEKGRHMHLVRVRVGWRVCGHAPAWTSVCGLVVWGVRGQGRCMGGVRLGGWAAGVNRRFWDGVGFGPKVAAGHGYA